MKQVVFATCRPLPALQPDDVPVARELESRGAKVTPAPWNGPFTPFAQADLVVLRSAWDYFEEPFAFTSWLQALENVKGVVVNSPGLMAWNVNKSYLLDLADRGAPVPPTRLCKPTATELALAMDELGVVEAVVKPVYGASASGLSIMRKDDPPSLERAAASLQSNGLVQPLIPEIRTLGETSCTFFGSEFSHAVVKRPKADSILVNAEHGGSTQAVTLSDAQLAAARSVLEMLPEPSTFARIDMVFTPPDALLMEVEVIEPELFVLNDPDAPARFADVLSVMQ